LTIARADANTVPSAHDNAHSCSSGPKRARRVSENVFGVCGFTNRAVTSPCRSRMLLPSMCVGRGSPALRPAGGFRSHDEFELAAGAYLGIREHGLFERPAVQSRGLDVGMGGRMADDRDFE